MTDQDNARALLAVAKARGIDLDPAATHLSLAQVSALVPQAEMTTRRAIWAGVLKAEVIRFRYEIPVLEAARYVAAGGGSPGAPERHRKHDTKE